MRKQASETVAQLLRERAKFAKCGTMGVVRGKRPSRSRRCMMSEMVRTQVDLPYEMVESLKQQSKVKGITMSQQILEALRAYLESQEDPILRADDVIFRIAGEMDSGVGDLSANHDRYL